MNIQGLAINDKLLWDADVSQLDSYAHKTYLISRVLNRGGVEDLKAIFRFYSDEELKEAVITSNVLNQKAMYFMSMNLKIDIKEFKCYNTILQNEFLSAH